MSTTLISPPAPPSSDRNNSLLRHVPTLTARAKELVTELNVHLAGVVLLGALALYLAVHLLIVWNRLNGLGPEAMDRARSQATAAELAARPLRGLDKKLENSTQDADTFYSQRLPYATSEVVAELGNLTKKNNVRLSRAQYVYAPVLSGAGALTEMRIDANVSGDYRPIVEFINAVERDKDFFVINGINLSGQQTGQVNLRIRLTTYLRMPNPVEMTTDTPQAEGADAGTAAGGTR